MSGRAGLAAINRAKGSNIHQLSDSNKSNHKNVDYNEIHKKLNKLDRESLPVNERRKIEKSLYDLEKVKSRFEKISGGSLINKPKAKLSNNEKTSIARNHIDDESMEGPNIDYTTKIRHNTVENTDRNRFTPMSSQSLDHHTSAPRYGASIGNGMNVFRQDPPRAVPLFDGGRITRIKF